MPTCPACLGRFDEQTAVCPNDGTPLRLAAGALSTAPTLAFGRGGGASPTRLGGPEASDGLVGTTLAERYQVVRRIGQGGMGVVYEARHVVIGRAVALKVLRERHAEHPEVARRLMNEARLASSIQNPHIVDIFDFGETPDGRTFVVMELLEGESLGELLRREGPLPEARVVDIGLQIADALGAAHARGIIHRDVKPENVFILRRDGVDYVKVLDFGISKAMPGDGEAGERLTHTGVVLGTPLYMSPEQARGEEALDGRIDVYALGVILYEALVGAVPFRGTNYLGIIADVLARSPVPPAEARPGLALSPSTEATVMRAMAKDRAERFPSMEALAAALRGEAVPERSALPRTPAPSGTAPRRARLVVTVLLIVAAVVVAATTVAGRRGPAPTKAAASSAPAPAPAPAPSPAPAPAPQNAPPAPVAGPAAAAPPTPPTAPLVLRIETLPTDGAEVLHGARRLGRTPLSLPAPRQPMTLTFRRPGYHDEVYQLTPPVDEGPLRIEMRPLVHRAAAPPALARPGGSTDPLPVRAWPPDRAGPPTRPVTSP